MNDPLDYCRVEGCTRRACRRGYAGKERICNAHWQRLKRTGSVLTDKPVREKHRGCNLNGDGTRKECRLAGCTSPASSRGYCHMHWKRKVRNDGIPYSGVPVGELTRYKSELRAEEGMRKGA